MGIVSKTETAGAGKGVELGAVYLGALLASKMPSSRLRIANRPLGGLLGEPTSEETATPKEMDVRAHGSWLRPPGSGLLAQASWLRPPGSWLMAHGSGLLAHPSWLTPP